MSFQQPAWLLLALAGVLVVLLHVRRRTVRPVPSVKLWQQLPAAPITHRRLQPPPFSLALLLQLLVIAGIALAMAAPRLDGDGRAQHVVYVVDTSGSMRATDTQPGRIDSAFAYLERDVGTLDARVSVVSAGPQSRLIAARQDPSDVRASIRSITAGDGAADWARAAQLVEAVLAPAESVRLVVLTDTAVAAQLAALGTAHPRLTIERHSFAGTGGTNAGFRSFDAEPLEPRGSRWRVSGSVAVAGPGTSDRVPVSFHFRPAGTSSAIAWTGVTAERRSAGDDLLRFAAELELPGPGAIEARLPPDPGPHDNAAVLVLADPRRSARVLLVGPPQPSLERALQAHDGVQLSHASQLPADASAFDLVVVNRLTLAKAPGTNTLWLGGAGVALPAAPRRIEAAAPAAWNEEHPLSADVAWGLIEIGSAVEMPRIAGADRVLQTAASPLIQARRSVAGREVWLAFDPEDSNWTALPSFPAFVTNLLSWTRAVPAAVAACAVGTPCKLDPRRMSADAELRDPDGRSLVLPASAMLAASGWTASEDADSFVPQRAGLYELRNGSTTTVIAANAFAESETVLADNAEATSATAGPDGQPVPWRWLLIAVVVCLAIEGWLAWRPVAGRPRRRLLAPLLAGVLLIAGVLALPLPAPPRGEIVVDLLQQSATGSGDAAVFGGNAPRVARDVGGAPLSGIRMGGTAPGVAPGLEIAAALVPFERRGRIALHPGGRERLDGSGAGLAPLLARGLALDIRETMVPRDQVAMGPVTASRSVRAGDTFTVIGSIRSRVNAPATLRVLRDGRVLSEQRVQLVPEVMRVESLVTETVAGSVSYELEIVSDGDPEPGNNRNGVIVDVAPAPVVGIVIPGEGPDPSAPLADALAAQGLTVKIIPASRAPWSLKEWLRYDIIALMNVPAIDLDTRQQELIETAVSLHGRGLWILGGENSFGPGGYFGTPLDRMSPLSARIPRNAPQAALVFVLDRSGSMSGPVGDSTRLEIAKTATREAIEVLHANSEVSIVVFDSEAQVLLPLQPRDTADVAGALGRLTPGGGTAIYPGLVEAFSQLEGRDFPVKHVVVMTDGLTQPGDFAGIIGRLRAEGAVVSGLAIGSTADPATVQQIARLGGGNFHMTRDFQALPGILAREAMMLSGEPVKTRRVEPRWERRESAFLAGLPDRLPAFAGYVQTTIKPMASLDWSIEDDDGSPAPLLAHWRFGNGQVLALASRGAGQWAAEWQASELYPRLWAHAARAAAPETAPPGLHATLMRVGDDVQIRAQLLDEDGRPKQTAGMMARIQQPGGELSGDIVLSAAAAGEFEGRFAANRPGDYRVRISAEGADREASIHVGYPQSLAFQDDQAAALSALAAAAAVGSRAGDRSGGWPWRPLWRPWALAGLAAFLVDLLRRYGRAWLPVRRRALRAVSA